MIMKNKWVNKHVSGVPYLSLSPFEDTSGLTHMVTTKGAGNFKREFTQSKKNTPYTYNTAIQSVAQAFGFDWHSLITAQQVHKDTISVIREEDIEKYSLRSNGFVPQTDALITNIARVPLSICIADCVPVFIFDPFQKVVGLVHSGWRGTALKIACKTVLKMKELFATKPHDCLVGIGPYIGRCCYGVGKEVAEAVSGRKCKANSKVRYYIDLGECIKEQLNETGIPDTRIFSCALCTFDNTELFYSYRREGERAGRMMALCMLK